MKAQIVGLTKQCRKNLTQIRPFHFNTFMIALSIISLRSLKLVVAHASFKLNDRIQDLGILYKQKHLVSVKGITITDNIFRKFQAGQLSQWVSFGAIWPWCLGTLRKMHTKHWFALSLSMQHLFGIPITTLSFNRGEGSEDSCHVDLQTMEKYKKCRRYAGRT